MENLNRRYDIDWLRVIAIAMLLIYHSAIGFQSWGLMIGFITNKESWNDLWAPMTLVNIWRIPLLFFISGMGVYFSIQKRNWMQLLKERTKRILVPFVFGVFVIVPIHVVLLQNYYTWELSYKPNPSHLWFLANIFIYTVVLAPFFVYIQKHKNNLLLVKMRAVLSHPFGLIIVVLIFIAEAIVIKPNPYEMYAMTTHGFVLGFLSFLFGFLFLYSGQAFWRMIVKWRWVFTCMAIALFVIRTFQDSLPSPLYLLSIESSLWIFSAFAFSYKHLNKNSKVLQYLSQAVFPIYIIHMVFIYLASYLVFPLTLDVQLKYFIVLLVLFAGSLSFYEFILKRLPIFRSCFGIS